MYSNPTLLKYAGSVGINQLVSKGEGAVEHLEAAIHSALSTSAKS